MSPVYNFTDPYKLDLVTIAKEARRDTLQAPGAGTTPLWLEATKTTVTPYTLLQSNQLVNCPAGRAHLLNFVTVECDGACSCDLVFARSSLRGINGSSSTFSSTNQGLVRREHKTFPLEGIQSHDFHYNYSEWFTEDMQITIEYYSHTNQSVNFHISVSSLDLTADTNFHKKKRFLQIGDSKTHGTIGGARGDCLYGSLLTKKLNENGVDIRWNNKGEGGANIRELEALAASGQYDFKYDLVLIDDGMNDCVNAGISETVYKNCYNSLLNRLWQNNPNCPIILTTISPTDDPERTPYRATYNGFISDIYNQNYTAGKNTFKADISSVFSNTSTTDFTETEDNHRVHPNPIGHSKIFNKIWTDVFTANGNDLINKLK